MATAPYNGFSKGFVTQGNPLQSSPETTKDELNFDLMMDGTRRKRLGLQIELGGSIQSGLSNSSSTVSSHLWDVQVDGTIFMVVQIGASLLFYDATTNPLTKNGVLLSYTLNTNDVVDFASGNGLLIIVSKDIRPIYIEYIGRNPDNSPIINVGGVNIQIRDFTGIEDGMYVTTRPGTLSVEHRYNLQNQGWDISNQDISSLA